MPMAITDLSFPTVRPPWSAPARPDHAMNGDCKIGARKAFSWKRRASSLLSSSGSSSDVWMPPAVIHLLPSESAQRQTTRRWERAGTESMAYNYSTFMPCVIQFGSGITKNQLLNAMMFQVNVRKVLMIECFIHFPFSCLIESVRTPFVGASNRLFSVCLSLSLSSLGPTQPARTNSRSGNNGKWTRQHRLPQDERAVRTKASLYKTKLSSLTRSISCGGRAASD